MIKRELAKDPKLAEQDWSRFLPKFNKRKAAKRTAGSAPGAMDEDDGPQASTSATPFPLPKAKAEPKPYTPFPPAQTPRKIDLQMASGEYFLKPYEKRAKKLKERTDKESTVREERLKQRAEAFVAPDESSEAQAEYKGQENGKRKREREPAGDDEKEAKVGKRKKKEKKGVHFADDG